MKRTHRAILSLAPLALGLWGACAGEKSTEPAQASIVVDTSVPLGPVNPYLFGHNISAGSGAGIFPSGTQLRTIRTGDGFWDPDKRKPVPEMAALAKSVRMSMLRYPGGCLVHNFDWRETVGPVEQRPNPDWAFGLDEFLALCKELHIEPMITVSDYVLPADQMPQHAAQLVEYLNAPATPEHPWAMKRQEWGHPEPYGVKWFELGNESEHGNHNTKPFRVYNAGQYADYARNCIRAMKAVDPTIQVGVHMVPGAAQDVDCEWNRTVARIAGPLADYVVIHVYAPKLSKGVPVGSNQEKNLVSAMMSVPEQIDEHLKEYRRMIEQECGRQLPLAVTEFNVGTVPNRPKPYRYTHAAALTVADLMRVFAQPDNGVSAANYWQLANGYWGMLQTQTGSAGFQVDERAAYPVMKLLADHLDQQLVKTTVKSPTASSPGWIGAYPANGATHQPGGTLLATIEWEDILPRLRLNSFDHQEAEASVSDGVLSIQLNGLSKKQYPEFATLRRPRGLTGPVDYRVSYEARFTGSPQSPIPAVSVGVMDARGYQRTGSAQRLSGGTTGEWETYSGTLNALVDAPGISLLARLESNSDVKGTFEIRNIRVEILGKERFPDYSLLTALGSLSEDGNTAQVIVINKSENLDIETHVDLKGFAAQTARLWEVNAPELLAQNGTLQTQDGASLSLKDGKLTHIFPAHSISAIQFKREE